MKEGGKGVHKKKLGERKEYVEKEGRGKGRKRGVRGGVLKDKGEEIKVQGRR